MQKAKFILSKKKVLEQYNLIKDKCDFVSYSSKTNPLVSPILEDNTGCFFSVHMINELDNIKDKSRVLFLAQGWDKNEIEELVSLGIRYFSVDNEPDLKELIEFIDDKDIKINLLLRLRLKENTLRTERYFVFGMKYDDLKRNILKLRENKNIGLLGVNFHRKTQNMAEWNLKYEISDLFDEEILKAIDLVNIGGGLPSEYANTNINVIESVFNKINEFREWLKEHNIKLMMEPGRFIAAPAGKLVTRVVRIYGNNIIVNASVYNSDMDALVVPVKLLVEHEGKGNAYVIKGITPCSMDLFRYKVYLNNPKEGDIITFLNAGAYNFSTDFCNLDKIETEIIEP